tara:strand:- start:155 stop:622 length:468 start_codon:yes stop_codon:yes gene_type:complete
MNEHRQLSQMKLTNGSEIVCEVVEWAAEDDNQLIAKNCMTIINYEYDDGQRGYAFKPWINFLDDERDLVMINVDHVISVNKPSDYLIDQYNISVTETLENAKARNVDFADRKIRGLKRLAAALSGIYEDASSEEKTDKDTSNVINFPRKDDDIIH